ncbi:hypothetical protein EMIHUDRAFT_213329 [Emiliania huxleyi CCMP1516]|uniref:Uncharacterized protein n=2 Tax=Emiliania huxleyi TaxID=2903 RepID=A0A0D3IMX6_EMIH1|nr:hypothetical protein EMIHUDRAFT_213329 [Emiliania huxleyi CCMP1516]EOD12611.1 hypothetical protein EMIHUDRAFT_213329 [Emiliania huxleyi CCMP1516]|eukprot:XP_005765040.1 hypothetical protein EMIHUDRAFT_213329 [Emiliania huxleyi CCMP1516]
MRRSGVRGPEPAHSPLVGVECDSLLRVCYPSLKRLDPLLQDIAGAALRRNAVFSTRYGAAWWRAHWAQLNVGQWLGVVEPCCLCGRPGSAGELWRAGAWRWANSTGRCAAPYLATTDDRWGVPGLRQAYVAHGMCGGLCQGWGCCEARGVAQPQDGSGEARGEGEGEGELSSDGDSDRSAGDPVWGSAALEDEWRAASLARQAVGDAAYAAAHAAGASRAEACDAAVRAVRLDEVEAQSSFLVRAGCYPLLLLARRGSATGLDERVACI